MADISYLDWPFFEVRHGELSDRIEHWCDDHLERCASQRRRRRMPQAGARSGKAGFLKLCIADGDTPPDVRSLAIARETLARHSGLADFAFAMQGLGSGAISLAGSEAQRAEWLPKVASGEAIAAFAMTEPDAGSDAANLAMTARKDGNDYVLDGEKTYISNGGIADFYTVLARTGEGEGARGLSISSSRLTRPA